MRKKINIITILALILMSSCSNDSDKCIYYKEASVTYVNGPTTGQINQNIPLEVSFGCTNGCGQFGSLEEKIQGNTRLIKITAKYEGCICTQDVPIRKTIYNFRSFSTGTYYLKFSQSDNLFLTDTIIIQ